MRLLCCPVCRETLEETPNSKSFRCINGHLFDKAKQGYVNLLLSKQKKSKHPGDTLEMVQARTSFLNQGFYDAVAQSFIEIALCNLQPDNKFTSETSYLDIACGEGFYTSKIQQAISAKSTSQKQHINAIGLDISTPAIKAAAKRSKHITWLVGSAYHLPVPGEAFDLASCLFCRVDYTEASRVLKPGGVFVVASTGPSHLIELREKIYNTLKPDTEEKSPLVISHLEKISEESLVSRTLIDSETMISNLLLMTPHYWRSSPEAQAKLCKQSRLNVTIDILFTVFKKTVQTETESCSIPNVSN